MFARAKARNRSGGVPISKRPQTPLPRKVLAVVPRPKFSPMARPRSSPSEHRAHTPPPQRPTTQCAKAAAGTRVSPSTSKAAGGNGRCNLEEQPKRNQNGDGDLLPHCGLWNVSLSTLDEPSASESPQRKSQQNLAPNLVENILPMTERPTFGNNFPQLPQTTPAARLGGQIGSVHSLDAHVNFPTRRLEASPPRSLPRRFHISSWISLAFKKSSEKTKIVKLKLTDFALHPVQSMSDAMVTRDTGLQLFQCPSTSNFEWKQKHAESVIHLLLTTYNRERGVFNHGDESKRRLRFMLLCLCKRYSEILSRMPLCVSVDTPVWAFGDIHGSFGDIVYIFEELVIRVDPKFQGFNVVFLGDYVDRGSCSVEVVAFLFAWAILNESQVTLLRGNHEDPAINGDYEQYGEGSFRTKCEALFGEVEGDAVWHEINDVFAKLPVAAVVNRSYFLCHGGVPRVWAEGSHDLSPNTTSPSPPLPRRVWADLLANPNFPRFTTLMPTSLDAGDEARAMERRVVRELLWNDPCLDEANIGTLGFRPSTTRGDCRDLVWEFTTSALQKFLECHGFELMIRAHQHKGPGLQLAQCARILTVFSCTNYNQTSNAAGGAWIGRDGIVRLHSWRVETQAVSGAWSSGLISHRGLQQCGGYCPPNSASTGSRETMLNVNRVIAPSSDEEVHAEIG